jgi:uncharacterized protein YecT (DUF1311 family)
MRTIILTGALLPCFVPRPPALWAQDCSKAENTHAIVAYHEERYKNADRELNKVYGESMKEAWWIGKRPQCA